MSNGTNNNDLVLFVTFLTPVPREI